MKRKKASVFEDTDLEKDGERKRRKEETLHMIKMRLFRNLDDNDTGRIVPTQNAIYINVKVS